MFASEKQVFRWEYVEMKFFSSKNIEKNLLMSPYIFTRWLNPRMDSNLQPSVLEVVSLYSAPNRIFHDYRNFILFFPISQQSQNR